MKIGTATINNRHSVIIIDGETVIDLAAACAAIGKAEQAPRSVFDIVQDSAAYDALIAEALASGAGRLPLSGVKLATPIPNPGKIISVALNNSANKDRILKGPDHAAFFNKPSSCLIGSGEAIEMRPYYGRVHPEPELVVVVAKKGRDIAEADAYDHVYGYTIMNDLTSPTMREDDSFHYRAIHPKQDDPSQIEYIDTWVSYPGRYKGTDTFGPTGPWIVTRDEIADPHDLTISCTHKGELVTEDSTANLKYHVPQLISYISSFMTLFPGDIISLGTALKSATSVGGKAVQNVDLNKFGGPVAVTVTGIGTLENPVVWK